ncbi:hypothetical protein HU200_050894 [Digitaria exilis]|uniref:Glabrous enhancer-binding protein-like DBD domain-containing protein n=1 Tax=Digitaria exilis TaxID=1010633 RepID=A0A835ATV8_9POAL|nr:hypothetical protein HU200_050894 [Digitaria exilis]
MKSSAASDPSHSIPPFHTPVNPSVGAMARKRRAPSPPPPPPPPQEESSEESSSEEEEEPPSLHPPRMPPPAAVDNDADSSEGSEDDSDTDAQAFQLRQVPAAQGAPHRVTQPESDEEEEEEEEGESSESESESEPENPEPVVQKKASPAAAGKSKAEQERKRPAEDPAPSGKAKKAKAGADKSALSAEVTAAGKGKKGKTELEKVAPEATPAGKSKKGKAGLEKAAPEATPAGKVKKGKAELEKAVPEAVKGKKGGANAEKPVALDSSSSRKPSRVQRLWGTNDEMKILEALAAHVKSEGTLPKTDFLIATVGDRLDRKNCTYTDVYEKVRMLKRRYEKAVSTGIVPSKEDELKMYKLSEAVWGEKTKEAIAATTARNDGAVIKSKKGQANKEKKDGNSKGGAPKEAATSTASQNGDSQKGSKKGQAIKEKTDRGVKSRLSKESTTTGNPTKRMKRDTHNEALDKDAISGALKEATTTGTQNGSDFAKSKRGKTDKGKMDIDADSLKQKDATTVTQNDGTLTNNKDGETHDEQIERDDNVQRRRRGFDELQGLYSNLSANVEQIEVRHPCGETLKRAFGFIDDEKAQSLESKLNKLSVDEAKVQIRRGDLKKEVLNALISLMD